jgi:bifunctional non-homologous end joining protein LigD
MQCLAVDALPEGPEWAYEFKLDGYRALGIKRTRNGRPISRKGKDLSARFPGITEALERLPDETVVDGEIVAIDAAGRPSFNDLQNHQTTRASLFYYLFDLLIYRGEGLRQRPLKERRATLETKIMSRLSDPIRLSEILVANPRELTELVRSTGFGGSHRQADGFGLRMRQALAAMGQAASKSESGVCHRRLRSQLGQFRFDRHRILRWRRSGLCRSSAQRIRTGVASQGLQTVPPSRDQ